MPSLTSKDAWTHRFAVHAKPKAKRSAIVGEVEGALEVAIAAPPTDGEANEELVRFLAKALGVPKRDVTIVRGEASRHKLVEVRGIDAETTSARLTPEPTQTRGTRDHREP